MAVDHRRGLYHLRVLFPGRDWCLFIQNLEETLKMEALKVEGVTKSFGGVRALQDISFSVKQGERLAIIGPNGAGKTTLFNVINGQFPASAGRIFFLGQEITTMPTHDRVSLGLARTFQLTSLFLNLTVLDNIMLALHGTRPSRFQMFRSVHSYQPVLERADELLGVLELREMKDLPVKTLSYGEQRKMEIALSLASDPKMLLLDEPGNGLTTAESTVLIKMIRNFASGLTLLIVAHDMDLVFSVADRIIVLHYGRMIAEGDREAIQADPSVKEIYLGIEEPAQDA
jgi:branched-chain amino acid transport system ATP-binding protein